MTTSKSDPLKIRAQAVEIVGRLKSGTLKSKHSDFITFVIVQDDKTVKITWGWKYIFNSSHAELIAAIMAEMTR